MTLVYSVSSIVGIDNISWPTWCRQYVHVQAASSSLYLGISGPRRCSNRPRLFSNSEAQRAEPTAVVIRKNIEKIGTSCSSKATVPNLLSSTTKIKRIEEENLRSILKLLLANSFFPLLLRHIQQLEVPPVVQRPSTISRQQQEHRHTRNGNQVEW